MVYLDCNLHLKDLCFQCAYDKICGGIQKSDCQTVKKIIIKKKIERETQLIKGRVHDFKHFLWIKC